VKLKNFRISLGVGTAAICHSGIGFACVQQGQESFQTGAEARRKVHTTWCFSLIDWKENLWQRCQTKSWHHFSI